MSQIDKLSPPKDFYESTLDWVEHSGLDKAKILFEIYPPLPIPKVKREEELRLITGKPQFSNKAFVVRMPGGRVVGEKAVISPDNKLLWDVSVEWYPWLPRAHSIFRKKKLPPLTKIKKTVAMLNHPAAKNYYHWMLEVLARIHLIQESRIKIDQYLINHRSYPFQLETLAACGIAPDKIIQAHGRLHLEAKELIVPSYVNLPNLWSCNYVRSTLLSHWPRLPEGGHERLYIRRRFSRKIVNEEEIFPLLAQYGFKSIVLEEMPLEKQVALFYNAQVVLSPHGAGLANLVFCKPGTTVIELFSPTFMEPHYWLISRLLHLDYHMIVGQSIKSHKYWAGFDSILIPLEELSKRLRLLS